ncbi:hypothetical protein N802_12485 [Knoellia sinensis KCTC 19936]|uniref:AB hydrolase-1 domain-containing protein n=1 Tax=Knoellia sinensis KCTC 19936 TaxID=1385520 RepID=A0A0A0JEB4_9MICO|nr:alpha/beta hydrolase [Knoellia sinensis]KGN34402.1 hypothetical protein N802_12485 [Knoellia sinensis KCTC 19936]
MTKPTSVATRTLSIPAPNGAMLSATEHLPDGPVDAGSPTVVLAHGWTLTRQAWARVVREVQSHRAVRVITYDQRGHGRSTWGSVRSQPIKDLGDDLAAVIAATAPNGPLVLGGHSMGGMTVMAYAGRHSSDFTDRVRGTVLVSTAASIPDRKAVPGEAFLMGAMARLPLVSLRPVPAGLHRWTNFGENPEKAAVNEVGRMINATRLATTGRYYFSLTGLDEREALATIATRPSHVIGGTKDRITFFRWIRSVHEGIAGSEFTILPGKGHMLPYEATDVVADALIGMIDES